jgi:2-oxoglutarate dehydrogenase E1 component
MAPTSDSFLTGSNIDFIEAQYARFLADPASVEVSWKELFGSLDTQGQPLVIDGLVLEPRPRRAGPASRGASASGQGPAEHMRLQSRVAQTLYAFRLRGHLVAQLDPLGVPRPTLAHVADAGLINELHFTDAELATAVDAMGVFDEARVPLRRLLERMRSTYCRHIGVEFAHLYDSERRRWLEQRMESCDNATVFSVEEQTRILRKLSEAETFETTIHTKFQAAKRFSLEGGEALVAMLDDFLELGGTLGVKEVVVGMAHRGRLNVLANIMGKPAEEIFSEFSGPSDPKRFLGRGDVKYHMGYSSEWRTRTGHTVHFCLAFNPSHLGVVYPVVEGRVRAKQDRVGGDMAARRAVVPLVVHGDAAFAGQGLIAETLNFSGLPAYATGGTIHVVVNNQVGYTTEADQGRSSLYCTGQAQMLDIPIFHVNGDDAEACVHVMRLATEYRQRFNSDVVIDLFCYRKYGHNEGDEPAFTQPKMYERIRGHASVRSQYAQALTQAQRLAPEATQALLDACLQRFSEAHSKAKAENRVRLPSNIQGLWSHYRGGLDHEVPQVETGLPAERVRYFLGRLGAVPEGFTPHPGVQKMLDARLRMGRGEEPVDWGAGELLAYASLATEGVRVRVAGQDTERGTFAHRHAVLHDVKTGEPFYPLDKLHYGQAPATVVNSPLCEMACLGYEYGYSLEYPDALVAWEAQFGDFANNGQVIIDQFLAASESKWNRLCALTLLLPHGYEGAGPEHSSARLERFLDLAAEDNLQVCSPTNAAQIFHLLRRQALRRLRKPLVVMTPKSLLRLAEAKAPIEDFLSGTYRRLIGEVNAQVQPAGVTRLLLCSGKVYFDLARARDAAKDATIAIGRVEQLYPLPRPELEDTLRRYPNLSEVRWVQEEPKNAGAWRYVLEPLLELTQGLTSRPAVSYVGRPASASPATGFAQTHAYEQKLLVEQAISRG